MRKVRDLEARCRRKRVAVERGLALTRDIVSPSGYIWAAEAGRFPIRIRDFDRFSDGTGEMQWRLLGRIPVVNAAGPDLTRSAAGRHASELIGLTGGALDPAVVWHEVDDHRALANRVDATRSQRYLAGSLGVELSHRRRGRSSLRAPRVA